MLTLGINAVFHDSAACLLKDGQILAASEEERFTGIKHGKRPIPFSAWELPYNAIADCLRQAGAVLGDVDAIGYSFDPSLLIPLLPHQDHFTLPFEPSRHSNPEGFFSPWEPLMLEFVLNAPHQLLDGAPHHLRKYFKRNNGAAPNWRFIPHHLAHAASAFFPSPFSESAVLTIDGRGEVSTTAYFYGKGHSLTQLGSVNMPHSLGLLYEQITSYLGFLHSSDEYKVMALASFGEPRYLNQFQEMVRVGQDGSYTIAEVDLSRLFGPPREPGATFSKFHFDIAASLQATLEDTLISLCSWLKSETQALNLCLAGGVALNCVANSRLCKSHIFNNIWVQPAAGDAGTALGAAMLLDVDNLGTEEEPHEMSDVYLGPQYSDEEVEALLKSSKLNYRRMANIAEETAELLAEERIVGWFQGRMEFGPRALGARSIIASPRRPEMQERLNEIKDREDFRPVAPAVIEEEASSWFLDCFTSPFMLFVFEVAPDKREKIPAVTHTDGSARVQTVNRSQNRRYYDLISAFGRKTGVPVIVNTSFNTKGKPIVCSPADALQCFFTSPLDALVIGSFQVIK